MLPPGRARAPEAVWVLCGEHILGLSAIRVNGRLGHFQSGAVMNGALVMHTS